MTDRWFGYTDHNRFAIFMIIVFLFFLGILLWSAMAPQPVSAMPIAQDTTPTPTLNSFRMPDPRTPLPPEMMANSEQTNGIVFGGGILVLIVVAGTLLVIRSRGK